MYAFLFIFVSIMVYHKILNIACAIISILTFINFVYKSLYLLIRNSQSIPLPISFPLGIHKLASAFLILHLIIIKFLLHQLFTGMLQRYSEFDITVKQVTHIFWFPSAYKAYVYTVLVLLSLHKCKKKPVCTSACMLSCFSRV